MKPVGNTASRVEIACSRQNAVPLTRCLDVLTRFFYAACIACKAIGAVSGNGIFKINLLLHAFPVVTAKERNVISIAFRQRSVHDGHNCRGTTGQWS